MECSKGNDATATLAKSVGLVKDSEYKLNEFACANDGEIDRQKKKG
ncbi:hypothetical protein [Brevibacillus laterosporus]|nr:hypothetical protein [Brevibacillus laterosporus]